MNTYASVMPAILLILSPLFGGILAGVDRKITARMQNRQGPPLTQPFWDVFKLWGKETMVSSPAQILFALGYLGFMLLALGVFFWGGDLLAIVFLTTFASVCMVLGAFAVRSPYAYVGGSRELLQLAAFEPVLIAAVAAIYLKTHTFMVSGIQGGLLPVLLPSLLALWMVLPIKMRKSPFDIATAHQEVVKGPFTEYSGPYYVIITVGEWLELLLLLLVITLFVANPWLKALLFVGSLVGEILIDNASARLNWKWLMRYSWALALPMSVLGIMLSSNVFQGLINALSAYLYIGG